MEITYKTLERLHKAIDYINSSNLSSLPNGRTTIDDDIYINVMEIETKKENIFEAHRNYIDIHYMIDGEEAIEIAPVENMRITTLYSSENDSILGEAKGVKHIIKSGEYCITLPSEAHSPALMVTAPRKIRKAVFKVRF